MPRLFTVDELVAAYPTLAKRDAVYDWLRDGELVGFKLGVRWRIDERDWEAFVEGRRAAAAERAAAKRQAAAS